VSDVEAEPAAKVFLRDDGVVVARIHPGVRQTIEIARANLRAAIAMRGPKLRPILVDIQGAEPLAPEVRREYTGDVVGTAFSAIAILIEGNLFGRMIGNIYLRVATLALPTQLFADEESALVWLRRYA
jgi:hypothetical protein